MALSRRDELKRVPWFSLSEWQKAYEDIYSNDTELQVRGYETLLIWKSRIPKLPVGVECTLSLLQVCLRDREWTPKISSGVLPLFYENDLSLMYCTTIMRFLNQISNIGPTKQTSLFQIAKQLKIPEWIVHLRHDAAHGHELPSIALLRMASNLLLTWLHEEYWKAESQSLQKISNEDSVTLIEEIESRNLIDIIELWMSVGLYMEADFKNVGDLPDDHLKSTLKDLYIYVKTSRKTEDSCTLSEDFEKSFRLTTARSYLLSEIYNEIRRSKDKSMKIEIIEFLLRNETFLFTPDFMRLFSRKSQGNYDNNDGDTNLPKTFVCFWQNFILMLHEFKILEDLTKNLWKIVKTKGENRERRKSASLWLKLISQSLLRLKIARRELELLENRSKSKKMSQKMMNQRLQSLINSNNPELKNCFWLGINSDVPEIFLDDNFAEEILLNADELNLLFINDFLTLISPELTEERKRDLIQILKIQTGKIEDNDNDNDNVYTVEDLRDFLGDSADVIDNQKTSHEEIFHFADEKIRNLKWELGGGDFNWGECAFGVLPWQMDDLESLGMINPPKIVPGSEDCDIIPGIIDKSKLIRKRVNWENVLRKNQRKRKNGKRRDDVIDKAMEIVKTRRI